MLMTLRSWLRYDGVCDDAVINIEVVPAVDVDIPNPPYRVELK